ncbi:MAG: NAD-dependent epimerase/dehydratase family protein [Crocinitomix sp.]|nr:NAD-dependent epimerase/dehydratase family protein [Crocinitomix sp.]
MPNKSRVKVLVTGASGTVGAEVLKQLKLIASRVDVTIFDKKNKNSVKAFSAYKDIFNFFYGDITNPLEVEKVCHNIDFVIHLAAIIPPVADDLPSLAFKVNVGGTENLVRSLERNSPNAFILYTSSISVYGDRLENPLIKVTDDLIPSEGDEYAITKIKAEEIIQNSKLDWSIFRLGAIMGNHKISKLMFHMPLSTALEIATPSDTARALLSAISKQSSLSKQIFNLGGGVKCQTTYELFLERSFKIFGLGKVDFPDKTFAEKSFHCGYYEDGIDLENILSFQKDSLNDYYQNVARNTPAWQKFFAGVFKKLIKKSLLKKSEPYHAFNTKDKKMMDRFFKNNETLNRS